ncbi:C69 family dipeptidase [Chloroflexota bacterium]
MCTMVVVGKTGTADGSTIIYHNEEVPPTTAQRLNIVDDTKHTDDTRKCGFETIPQIPATYRHIGDRYWSGAYPPGDWVTGMNKFGLIVVSNAQQSKEKSLAANKGVTYFDMTEVVIERARTAQQAVIILSSLIDKYGVAGHFANNCWVIADQKNAWYVEASIRHWVGRRIRENELMVIGNRYLIDTEWELSSRDLIKYATSQGWFSKNSGKQFSWKDVYGDPINQNLAWLVNREKRMKDLLTRKWGEITLRDCFEAMRDHSEEHKPGYPSPHETPTIDTLSTDSTREKFALCSGLSVFGVVFHLRSWLPREIGVVMWYRMAAACSSINLPVYAGITELPAVYTMDLTNEPDQISAWWCFKFLMDSVDKNYAKWNPSVRRAWFNIEKRMLKETSKLEETALEAYRSGKTRLVEELLTRYTYRNLMIAYRQANSFNKQLQCSVMNSKE